MKRATFADRVGSQGASLRSAHSQAKSGAQRRALSGGTAAPPEAYASVTTNP